MLMYLLVVIMLMILVVYYDYNVRIRKSKRIQGPKGHFLLGNTLDLIVPPVQLFSLGRVYAKQFKDMYTFLLFNVLTYNIYNPEDIESVISSTKNNEKSFIYDIVRPWLGDGLLLSKGQKWHDRRKILTPTFHFNILRNFCVTVDELTRRMVDGLRDKVGNPVDITPIVTEYTLVTTCETSMGTRLKGHESRWKSYKKAIYELGDVFVARFSRVYWYIDFVYRFTDCFRKQNEHLKVVHEFTKNVINERKEYLKTHTDEAQKSNIWRNKRTAMLDLLIAAKNEGLIDDKGIQEEVDTFMFEGHDTTATGLSFCLMLLANNSHIQEKIVEEVTDIIDDPLRPVTLEDLSKMRYLERCIKESLRLYPPVHFMNRVITGETKIAGHIAPRGSLCNIHIYDLHRSEELFPSPEQFDPDRFLPENCINRHPYAYIPFSAGPRNCIGQKFAMLVMKSAISKILLRFRILPVTTPKDIVLMSDLVLRNSGPILATFVERIQ